MSSANTQRAAEADHAPAEPTRRHEPVRATALPHAAHVAAHRRLVARAKERALGDAFLDFDRPGDP